MTTDITAIAALLQRASDTHEAVFYMVDGADPDWASFYSDFLVNHTPLGLLLGAAPVRRELTAVFVELDQRYAAESPAEAWPGFYAGEIARRFGTNRRCRAEARYTSAPRERRTTA